MVVGALLVGGFVLVGIGLLIVIRRGLYRSGPAGEPPPGEPPVVQLPPEIDMTVRALLLRRQKIQAIKLVRDNHPGMSLRDAKDLVEGIQAELLPLNSAVVRPGRPLRTMAPADGAGQAADLATRARQLKLAGQEVQAVRLVRGETGMGLTEATAFVRSLS
jgi:ribosomal protein L7/L12